MGNPKILIQCSLFFVLLFIAQPCSTVEAAKQNSANQKQVICHYEKIFEEENQCTNIVYFISDFFIDSHSFDADETKPSYRVVRSLRRKGINVSFGFNRFDLLTNARDFGETPEGRARFVVAIVEFMERNHFNGFTGTCWANDQERSAERDKMFMEFVRQLSEAFKPRGFSLSMLIMNKVVAQPDFDVKKLSEYLDWMTIWPHESFPEKTTLSAPLYSYIGDSYPETSLNLTANYLVEKGIPSSKIILPVLSVVRMFELNSGDENGLDANIHYPSRDSFRRLCRRIKDNNWTVVHDTLRVGTYAFHKRKWIAYHDVEDAQRIAEYVMENNLGGGSIVEFDSDDIDDNCGCGRNPIFNAFVQVLQNVTNSTVKNCT